VRVNVSPRHLRRLFIDKAGASPLQVHQAHRISVAKQLLTETALPITQVALAAGFSSVRRFNDAFHARCGIAPSAVRRRASVPLVDGIRLRLVYRPPFDFAATLATLKAHALPGIEHVAATAYERNVSTGRHAAWIRITANTDKPELQMDAVGLPPEAIQPLVRRVRRMFDLDADLHAAHEVLRQDPRLAASIAQRPGLRIPSAWDGFEWAVTVLLRAGPEAVDGSDRSLLPRLIERYGEMTTRTPLDLDRLFPSAATLATADLETSIGATRQAAHAVRRLALAVRDQRLDFSQGQSPYDFVERFHSCTGTPLSQAYAVAWRALGDCDAWPVTGRSLLASQRTGLNPRAASWRPWRSYAALHLGGEILSGAFDDLGPK